MAARLLPPLIAFSQTKQFRWANFTASSWKKHRVPSRYSRKSLFFRAGIDRANALQALSILHYAVNKVEGRRRGRNLFHSSPIKSIVWRSAAGSLIYWGRDGEGVGREEWKKGCKGGAETRREGRRSETRGETWEGTGKGNVWTCGGTRGDRRVLIGRPSSTRNGIVERKTFSRHSRFRSARAREE